MLTERELIEYVSIDYPRYNWIIEWQHGDPFLVASTDTYNFKIHCWVFLNTSIGIQKIFPSIMKQTEDQLKRMGL